ncbi:hypothetical protein D5039_00215 [Verminephrobacter aporrectodeae subsp. tuberculatae]|uniref:Uncharacterized protein n=1 Tax=Verminephrobacter aporrectodeae subsp. tuberculatae TaxID=1110392 RepID=A0ABT3KMX4_9BURK|nr:hypothetical protein [Verminephrobacter aporrectodeae]MCW5319659.1 hypothetical protein [Verminephrobacter aporrectodeae subsp. tuberculatae]
MSTALHPSTGAVAPPQAPAVRLPLIHHMSEGLLGRAFVTLPEHMCPDGQPHERVVFFEAPSQDNAFVFLQTLLAHTWSQETSNWVKDGHIHGVTTMCFLLYSGLSENRDFRFFELDSDPKNGVRYANPAQVDLFVTPKVQTRLHKVLRSIEGVQQ